MKHISRAKKCKDIYGEDYDKLKKEKALSARLAKSRKYNHANAKEIREKQAVRDQANAEEKREKQAVYNRLYAPIIRMRQAQYNKLHRVQICLKQKQRVALKRSKATSKDRLRLFRQEIKDGPTYVCMSCDRSLFLRGVKIIGGDPKLKFEESVGKDFLLEKILHANNLLDFYIFVIPATIPSGRKLFPSCIGQMDCIWMRYVKN